jgi:hypothetical protein
MCLFSQVRKTSYFGIIFVFLILSGPLALMLATSFPSPKLVYAQELTILNEINLSDDQEFSIEEQITSSGNNVYIVWRDNNATSLNSAILFKRSNNSGVSFEPTVTLSRTSGFSFEPRISASGNNIYVVWTDNTEGSNDVYFIRSTNNGLSFDPLINLSKDMTGLAGVPHLASSGSNVYVVWRDTTPGNADIFFTRSTNNDMTFGNNVNLSNNSGISGLPQIAAAGSAVYVVWQDTTPGNDDILFRASVDGGVTFGDTPNLSNHPGYSFEPRIVAEGNSVYIVWTGRLPDGFMVFFKGSNDNGTTFGPKLDLSQLAAGNQGGPSFAITLLGPSANPVISASESNVHVTWRDNRYGNEEILYSRSENGGANFTLPINLSNTSGYSSEPKIRVGGNNIFIAWSDHTFGGNPEILIRGSMDNGTTFSEILNLSNNTGTSGFPELGTTGTGAMALSRNNLYVIWHDDTPGNTDILFSKVNVGAPG